MQFTEWQAQQLRNQAHFYRTITDMREEIVHDKPVDSELMRAKDWNDVANLLDRRN